MAATKTVISQYFGKLVKLPPKHRRFLSACEAASQSKNSSEALVALFIGRLKTNANQKSFGSTSDITKAIYAFVYGYESQWHKAQTRSRILLAQALQRDADYLYDFVPTPNATKTANDIMRQSLEVAQSASKERMQIDNDKTEGEKYGRIADMKRNQLDCFLAWLDTKEARRIIDDYCWLRNRKTKIQVKEARELYVSLGYVQ